MGFLTRSAAPWRRALLGALLLLPLGAALGLGGQAPTRLAEYDQVPVQTVDLANVPFKGPGEAPIKVLEFADFMCASCQSLAGALGHYVPRSGNRVAVYFKNFPLDQTCNPAVTRVVHEGACNLALGAVCAHEQGRFWPYHDKVFATRHTAPGVEDVLKMGGEAGLDQASLRTCLSSPRAKATLAKEIAEAQRVGVSVTPTVLVNGRKLIRVSDFRDMVEKEATRLGLPADSASPAQP